VLTFSKYRVPICDICHKGREGSHAQIASPLTLPLFAWCTVLAWAASHLVTTSRVESAQLTATDSNRNQTVITHFQAA
jgi:hypothetical protein